MTISDADGAVDGPTVTMETTRMTRISKKLALAASVTAVVAGLGTGVALAAGETDDNISPANTNVTATNTTNIVFKIIINNVPVTVTCKNSSISGTTPASGLGPFNISNPSFTNCTDSLGGTDTVTTTSVNGSWQLTFLDVANDETQTEPNSGDRLQITIPKAGAKFTLSSFSSCVVTVSGTIAGAYNDVNTLSFNGVSIPVQASGCTATATMTGTYKFISNLDDVS